MAFLEKYASQVRNPQLQNCTAQNERKKENIKGERQERIREKERKKRVKKDKTGRHWGIVWAWERMRVSVMTWLGFMMPHRNAPKKQSCMCSKSQSSLFGFKSCGESMSLSRGRGKSFNHFIGLNWMQTDSGDSCSFIFFLFFCLMGPCFAAHSFGRWRVTKFVFCHVCDLLFTTSTACLT